MPGSRTLATRTATYELEIPIEASRERTWKALVQDTNTWWLADFHMVGEGSVVTLDARAGGQLIEKQPDGGSLLWYTVQMCQPERALHLVGFVTPEWGGPTTTMLGITLEDRGQGCTLKVTDALTGHVAEETVDSLKSGWIQLFEEGLKAYLEP